MGERPIDSLILNAGVFGVSGEQIENISWENLELVMYTNAFAPLMLLKGLLPNLLKGTDKLVVGISSGMASISDNTFGRHYAYRMSKVALNMMIRSFALDKAKSGLHALALDPGWVKTDMGGKDAPILPEESVAGLLNVMGSFHQYESGGFFHYTGRKLSW